MKIFLYGIMLILLISALIFGLFKNGYMVMLLVWLFFEILFFIGVIKLLQYIIKKINSKKE